MPLMKEVEKKLRSRAFIMRLIIEMREKEAVEQLDELHKRQAEIKPDYDTYFTNYNTFLKPYEKHMREYVDNEFMIEKLKHFLQGQAEYHKNHPVTKIPYGETSKKKQLSEREAAFANLSPELQEELLRKAGLK